MTTILPEKNKKELKKDYCLNFFNSFLWAIFIVGIVFFILQLTIYVSISIEEKSLSKRYVNSNQQERSELINKYKEKLTEIKINLNKFNKGGYSISEVIEYINLIKPESISINSFSIDDQKDIYFVSISGVSFNREDLLDFTKGLDDGEKTKEFNLPLSSFTKDKEIPFSLTFKFIKNE